MLDLPTIRPSNPVPWPILGQAIDYRLRFYFPQNLSSDHISNLIAYTGAQIACGLINAFDLDEEFDIPGCLSIRTGLDFFENLYKILDQSCPTKCRLEKVDEDILLRYCVVLGAFDAFFRGGFQANSILLQPQPRATVEELLAVAEMHWIEDLRTQSWGFYDQFAGILDEEVILNPTFSGSGFIGGADADLIVGNCLIDVKSTINPLKEPAWVYQLLGYALLDWDNKYGITEVAIYFARQQYLLRWGLDELIAELTGGTSITLSQLREQWKDMLDGMTKSRKPFFNPLHSEGEGGEERAG